MSILFQNTIVNFYSRSLSVFFFFYTIIIFTFYISSQLNWLSVLLPFFLLIIFWVNNKILLKLEYEEKTNKMKIIILRLMFFKCIKIFSIEDLSYSYKEEKTGRLTSSLIFRIYCREMEVFNRYHGLDGLKGSDVKKIIEQFQNLNIKKNEK